MRENKKYTLVGVDGNAYYVMGFVVKCMRQEHKTLEEISEYYTEAMKGDYYNLLRVSMDKIDELNELDSDAQEE